MAMYKYTAGLTVRLRCNRDCWAANAADIPFNRAQSSPIWRRLGRLVFHAHAALNGMFCRGGESPRAIKIRDPMPAVGPSLRPAGRPAAGRQAVRLVAVPGRDGGRPARGACCRARHARMHVGQELLVLGSAHENPHDGFPPRRCRVRWPAWRCLRARRACPGSAPPGGRPESGLPASAGRRTRVIWLSPRRSRLPGLCGRDRLALSNWGMPCRTTTPMPLTTSASSGPGSPVGHPV